MQSRLKPHVRIMKKGRYQRNCTTIAIRCIYLETNSVASVLRQFMIWIEAQTSANNNSRNRNRRASTNVILVAHNGNKFDHPILQRACEDHGVSFPRCRISFVDSIPLLKSAIPGRREMSLPSLVRDLLPEMDFQGENYGSRGVIRLSHQNTTWLDR